MNDSTKGSEIMRGENHLLECQKEFLFNSIYKTTDWNVNQKTFMYTCNKGRVHICYDIPNDFNLDINKVIDIHQKMLDEMFKVCQKCKCYNQ